MKKIIFFLLCINSSVFLQAQNVGVGTPAPTEKLDVAGNVKVNGVLKFSGAAPAAFKITLAPGMRYSNTNPLTPDATSGLFIIIDHPLCNNDPEALLQVTSVDFITGVTTPLMRITYEPANGYWFLRLSVGFLTNNQNRWNILITKTAP